MAGIVAAHDIYLSISFAADKGISYVTQSWALRGAERRTSRHTPERIDGIHQPHTKEPHMDVQSLLAVLIIGAVAGWLAGLLMRGGGFGLLGNIVVGIIGAVIGSFLFGLLGITASGLIGSLITAVVGAGVLLFIVGLFAKKT